jgi:hypothetical protein
MKRKVDQLNQRRGALPRDRQTIKDNAVPHGKEEIEEDYGRLPISDG